MPVNKIVATPRARAAIVGSVSAIALAISVFQPWEGRKLIAYRDMVGVVTICDGDTTDVRMGMKVTNADCDKRTWVKLQRDYVAPLNKCLPALARAPKSLQAAFYAMTWNIGVGAACGSTAGRLLQKGDLYGACIAITKFDMAGHKVVPGLVHRREMGDASRIGEAELCVSGL